MLDLLAQDLPALGVIREPLQDCVEVTRLLTGSDGGAKDLGERLGKVAQALGKRVTFHDARAHAEHDALVARFVALLSDREQRLFERQAGTHERCELPCDHGEIERTQTRASQSELERPAALLDASRLFLRDLGDLERQKSTLAKKLAHLAWSVTLEYAATLLAGAVDGGVFEGAHAQSAG